jgi:integrase
MTDAAPFPSSGALAVYVDAPGVSMQLPALIADAGEQAARATLKFFTARISNAHTRRAYGRAGLPSSICNHSFRATGITVHQENGGRLEDAQELAGHADARTTRLYIRKARKIAQAEVERVQL